MLGIFVSSTIPPSSIQLLLYGLRNQITKLQRIVFHKVTVKSLRDSPGSRERNVSAWPIWHLFYMPRCPFNFFPCSWPYFRTRFPDKEFWWVKYQRIRNNFGVLASKWINFILKDQSWKEKRKSVGWMTEQVSQGFKVNI